MKPLREKQQQCHLKRKGRGDLFEERQLVPRAGNITIVTGPSGKREGKVTFGKERDVKGLSGEEDR